MAEGNLPTGGPLLGFGSSTPRQPNTFRPWQYVIIVFVMVMGGIYAAPNLFQPDPALQIRSALQDTQLTQADLQRASVALEENGVEVIGMDLIEGSGFIRVASDDDQLKAQTVLARLFAIGEYTVALNRASTTPPWLADLGGKPMSLGLDLSGGVHFLLQVDMDKYLDTVVRNTAESMQDTLREQRVRSVRNREWVYGRDIEIAFSDEQTRENARSALKDFEDFQIREVDFGQNPGLQYRLTNERVQALEDRAISQNLTSLRNRVNELGVSEPQVQRLGRSRIVVDLPGIQDSARAKDILNKFANLEFRLAAEPNTPRFQRETYSYEGRDQDILRRIIVTGNNVQDAQQAFDPETSQPIVLIELDGDGGNRMHDSTKDNIGRQMAILFIEQKPLVRQVMRDGELVEEFETKEEKRLISVATVRGALGFRFEISGISLQEAQDLALLLRAGALAAPMYIVEERTVGASLGDENIESGWQSVSIGFAIVLIFMLFYYRLFGLFANVALTVNLILLVAIMSVLGATLTLPGIAGIVLTVGMAVDANVLIFSRIREELQNRPPQQAIQAGFERALLTITDANVTTFFVAIILLSIGSGPVRGFAVTLAVGIATSMFTAIMITRAQVNLVYGGRAMKVLKI
ncbi:MAG: protein translocase subunit SecD [Pseudomonadales bacterium]|jgi:preprotein translocase subunit SecD|nr:protein translocase subunit SecD [Pseudomonadales bacterium]